MVTDSSPSFPDLLKPVAGRALETALNRALALDPETRGSLRALDGRRVTLALEGGGLALELRVDGDQLRVGPVDPDNTPDLGVRSSLGGLLSQLPTLLGGLSGRDDAPPIGRMHISGDADLARRLQRLAEGFDPDWQQPFARVFGDVLGVQVANALATGLRQARIIGENVAQSAAEYVTEESQDVVARAELDAFHDDVDALRDDAARLAARVSRLRTTLESTTTEATSTARGNA